MPANAAAEEIAGRGRRWRRRACSGPRSRSARCRPRAALEHLRRASTLAERSRLRDGLARVRDAGENERLEAVSALVRAVHDGVGFPSPAPPRRGQVPVPPHRGDRRRTRSRRCSRRARARSRSSSRPRSATSGRAYRADVWSRLDHDERAAVRPTLSQIPGMSATRTAMYALDLRDRIAHRR